VKIRALTGFLDPGWPLEPQAIAAAAACLKEVRQALSDAGYEVQTLRLATPPPREMDRPVPVPQRPRLAGQLEAECFVNGIDYIAIGPAMADEIDGIETIPEILAHTENVFASTLFADPEEGLSLPAAAACGRAICQAAAASPDGFANLRQAALANVGPGSPFFPAAYHRGGPPALGIATEAAELAVDSLRDVSSPAVARRRLVGMIEAHAAAITRLVEPLAVKHETRYLGLDFSLAPYPEHLRSLGTAMESFGVPAVGLPGSAAAAAFLADCLDQAQFHRTGFCGLFLPVLEDSTLAERAGGGNLSISDLLLYSTLCGTGLDTLPLPGDTSPEALSALLVDLGAVALRLNKPLTARLMPLPGKAAGDDVHFDFPYFADSTVLPLPAKPLGGLLAGDGTLDIGPRRL
jgi:uncharacterized protein (UPF0210 family)